MGRLNKWPTITQLARGSVGLDPSQPGPGTRPLCCRSSWGNSGALTCLLKVQGGAHFWQRHSDGAPGWEIHHNVF